MSDYSDVLRIKLTKHAVVEIEFPGGDLVKIDRQDLKFFAEYAWYPVKGHGRSKYLIRNGDTGVVGFHREIMNPPDHLEIDHINRDGLDNRRENLRIVTHQQNQNNLPDQKHSSKYRYVTKSKTRGRWHVYITHNGKTKNVGSFLSEIGAAVAANNYIIKNKLPKELNPI